MRTQRVAALIALVALTTPAFAQRWRSIDASRQLRDSGTVDVRLQYGAGKLELRPLAAAGTLYSMTLRYDAEQSEPLTRWDADARHLDLGLKGMRGNWKSDDDEKGAMHAELSVAVPIRLAVEVGAVDGDLQFGGLRLLDLSLKAGAADITARWDQPNRERMAKLAVDVGAAAVRLVRAGNAHAERVSVTVGAGGLELDLGGEWTRDVVIDARVAMGKFTLRLPDDVGIMVEVSSFLLDFDKTGLRKRGNAWYSDNYDEAPRKVRLDLSGTLGKMAILRDTK